MTEYWEKWLKNNTGGQIKECSGCLRCSNGTKKGENTKTSDNHLSVLEAAIKTGRLGDTIRRTMMTYIKKHNVF